MVVVLDFRVFTGSTFSFKSFSVTVLGVRVMTVLSAVALAVLRIAAAQIPTVDFSSRFLRSPGERFAFLG